MYPTMDATRSEGGLRATDVELLCNPKSHIQPGGCRAPSQPQFLGASQAESLLDIAVCLRSHEGWGRVPWDCSGQELRMDSNRKSPLLKQTQTCSLCLGGRLSLAKYIMQAQHIPVASDLKKGPVAAALHPGSSPRMGLAYCTYVGLVQRRHKRSLPRFILATRGSDWGTPSEHTA